MVRPFPPRRDPHPSPRRGPPEQGGLDILEGRNPVMECLLRERRRMVRIFLDSHATVEGKLAQLLELAASRKVPIQRVDRGELDRRSFTGVHNGIIAEAEPLPDYTMLALLEEIESQGQDPFIVLVDEPQYEHNLGAILRSGLGLGVSGVVVPTRRGKGINAVVQRVSMGGAELVPLVREGISSCLALLHRRGIPIVGADMEGQAPWSLDLSGPLALVLGGEDKGLSPVVKARCDAMVAIPIERGLESFNLSVSASILMYERARQTRLGKR